MSESSARFELDFSRLGRSIDEGLLAAAASVFWLVFAAGERGFPPFDAPLPDAIDRFGLPPQAALDLWRQCAALDRQSRCWTGRGLEIPAYAAVVAEVRRARERTEADTEGAARLSGAAAGTPSEEARDVLEPDEAVGKAEPGDPDNQQRLGRVTGDA